MKLITEEELKCFTYKFKKTTSFGLMYLLPNIQKRLVNVPGHLFISNSGPTNKKSSEFLDHHLQSIMGSRISEIRDTNNFLLKLKNLNQVLENAVLVTTDIVAF